MPLRLPSRRPHAPKRPVPFRRRAAPTPQATRLMQVSLVMGLLLLAVLAALFVPKALEHGGVRPPSVAFSVEKGDNITLRVASVSVPYPLGTYRAELNVTGAERSYLNTDALGPDRSWAGGDVTLFFSDADGDGALSVGDTFTIVPMAGAASYHLLLFHETRDRAQPPCPCAVGQARLEYP